VGIVHTVYIVFLFFCHSTLPPLLFFSVATCLRKKITSDITSPDNICKNEHNSLTHPCIHTAIHARHCHPPLPHGINVQVWKHKHAHTVFLCVQGSPCSGFLERSRLSTLPVSCCRFLHQTEQCPFEHVFRKHLEPRRTHDSLQLRVHPPL